jgi:NADPH:quinone reductase
MRAMVIEGFGGADRLHPADVPTPAAVDGEVLIRVGWAGVNPVDWKIREGWLQALFPHQFPLIPGWDAAGTVAATGAGVEGFAVGDKVWAYCRKPVVQWGTYAEFVTMPADAIAPIPGCLEVEQAAAIPLVALTSWQALFDAANLVAGQTVLIHAGAGGIGSLAVPLAKGVGATVVATASAGNHAYVRELGADHVIDYAVEDFVAATRTLFPDGVDVVYETIGGETLARSYRVLRRGGFLVSIVDQPLADEAAKADVRHAHVFVAPNGGQLRQIAALFDSGRLRPPTITPMPLAEAAQAQELSRQGHVRGKIVLKVA